MCHANKMKVALKKGNIISEVLCITVSLVHIHDITRDPEGH